MECSEMQHHSQTMRPAAAANAQTDGNGGGRDGRRADGGGITRESGAGSHRECTSSSDQHRCTSSTISQHAAPFPPANMDRQRTVCRNSDNENQTNMAGGGAATHTANWTSVAVAAQHCSAQLCIPVPAPCSSPSSVPLLQVYEVLIRALLLCARHAFRSLFAQLDRLTERPCT